ncbi:hypothetical protein PHMEG_00025877 [Phytophthora megakarya]|uniref:Uncharacterized protein n=1 Tax=Phytophthora megakarya TaxID=4795 RepID=A0A225VAY5_9STRA|nr:hypothetical protein PHMEG_00025877 [Phytophthora megakarya]
MISSPLGMVDMGEEDASVSGLSLSVINIIMTLHRAKSYARNASTLKRCCLAFRNISIHSNSVYLFAGRIEEGNVIIIELCAPFGWMGSAGFTKLSMVHARLSFQ